MDTFSSIVVIGSSNTDMVIKAESFPLPGETILGGQFFMFPGGKGANQAVAAARLGGKVTFIAKVGSDIFGKQALDQFTKEGINTQHVTSDSQNPSGVALITVDAKGENTIVVAQGSNGMLSEKDVEEARRDIQQAGITLMQLEIPIQTVMHAARLSHSYGNKVILNPAPAMSLPDELFRYLYLITPNRSESQAITGIAVKDLSGADKAAQALRSKGVQHVVITLGAEGAYIFDDDGGHHIAAPKVNALDSTAAGDIFNGALAVAISEGENLLQAVKFANSAAAISVTKMGAQASAPYRKELN